MNHKLTKICLLICFAFSLTACGLIQNKSNHSQKLSQTLQAKDQEIFYIFKRNNSSAFNEKGGETPDTIVIKTDQHFETYWLASMEQPPKGLTLNDLSKLSDKAIIKKLNQLDVSSVDQAITEIQSNDRNYASKPAKEFGMGFKLITNYQKDKQKIKSEDVEILSTTTEQPYTTLSQLNQSKTFKVSKSTYNGLARTDSDGNIIEGIFIRSKTKMALEKPTSSKQATKSIIISYKQLTEVAKLNQALGGQRDLANADSQTQEQSKADVEESSAETPWNADKSQELANFMASWGQQMGQYPYKDITNQVAAANISFDTHSPADISYSENGISNSEYTLVASYEYWYSDMQLHRYLFVIQKDGTPQVLYSQNNQGFTSDDGETYAYIINKETDNADLKNGFADIVNHH